jgi:hypothetical protein
MAESPKFRAHVFYYPHSAWNGPTWTWCREIEGDIHDEAWNLPACASWTDAWDKAHAWLQRKYAPMTPATRLYGEPR